MSLLDELQVRELDRKEIINPGYVINLDIESEDVVKSNDDSFIWFCVDNEKWYYSESTICFMFKRLLLDLSNIPNIEELSDVYLVKRFGGYLQEICIGIRPDIRSDYSSIHLIWSVFTMIIHSLGFEENKMTIMWKEHYHSEICVNDSLYGYFRVYMNSELFLQFHNYQKVDIDYIIYKKGYIDLSRVIRKMTGHTLDSRDYFYLMERATDWYMKRDCVK